MDKNLPKIIKDNQTRDSKIQRIPSDINTKYQFDTVSRLLSCFVLMFCFVFAFCFSFCISVFSLFFENCLALSIITEDTQTYTPEILLLDICSIEIYVFGYGKLFTRTFITALIIIYSR